MGTKYGKLMLPLVCGVLLTYLVEGQVSRNKMLSYLNKLYTSYRNFSFHSRKCSLYICYAGLAMLTFAYYLQGPDDLFECISQALLNAVDRDAVSGWGGVVHIM